MAYKLAVIPWSDDGLRDKIFVTDDDSVNVDHRNNQFYRMQKAFEKKGDSFHTIDLYKDLGQVDYFLFFELDWNWLEKVIKAGGEGKTIYCNAEPPTVNWRNCPKGYRFLGKFFPYILTWNDDWIDRKRIFKRNIPYFFEENFGKTRFMDKKLLTSISGNKKSKHPDELYSEREKVIAFFEQNYPEEFDFYGTGWNKEEHPAYCGKVDKKAAVYHQYKFAVCFENMKNIKGYVSEKIFDCLTCGIVPIYAGAENIIEYVPQECFIDYWMFRDYQELAEFLLNINEERYQMYLDAAQKFLHSDILDKFSGEEYARNIYAVMDYKKDFHIALADKWYVKFLVRKRKYISGLKRWIKSEILGCRL